MSQKVSRREIVRVITARLLAAGKDDQAQKLWLRRLAAYMVTHKLVNQTDLILNEIAHELYVQAGLLSVEVTSARQLSDSSRQDLKAMLQAGTNARAVNLHESIDTSLLGGFTARTADAEIDASVKTKLKALAALV